MTSDLKKLEAVLFGLQWDISVAEQGLEQYHARTSGALPIEHLMRAKGGLESARAQLPEANAIVARLAKKGGRS